MTEPDRDTTADIVNHHLAEAADLLLRPQDYMREAELDNGNTHGDIALRSIANSLYAIATILEQKHIDGTHA